MVVTQLKQKPFWLISPY